MRDERERYASALTKILSGKLKHSNSCGCWALLRWPSGNKLTSEAPTGCLTTVDTIPESPQVDFALASAARLPSFIKDWILSKAAGRGWPFPDSHLLMESQEASKRSDISA